MTKIDTFEEFTVAGTKSDKIMIFDIDETLLSVNAKIDVIKNGEVIRRLTNTEFNTYKPNDGETFDFSELRKIEYLRSAKHLECFKLMKQEYDKGTHICICTARSGQLVLKQFFLEEGINIKSALIYALSDHPWNCNSVGEMKQQCLQDLYSKGYRNFMIFDDNEDVIRHANEFGKKHNDIVITTYHIINGKINK